MLEVLGQAVDSLREQRDLDLRRTGIPLVRLELLDQALLALDGKRHRQDLPQSPHPRDASPGRVRKRLCFVSRYGGRVPWGSGKVKLTAAGGGDVAGNLRLQVLDRGKPHLVA